MFEEVVKQLPLEVSPNTLNLSMEEYNVDYMKNKLFGLDKLSDEELYNLVCKTYRYLLDEMLISKDVDLINFLYTNPRFIMTLSNVLSRPDIKLTNLQIPLGNLAN